jgi:hypothetical protein
MDAIQTDHSGATVPESHRLPVSMSAMMLGAAAHPVNEGLAQDVAADDGTSMR